MSMRCANCGSKKVVPVSKKDSFSVGKAVAGNILFGPAGTVMGINGKETHGYYCSTCGVTLDYLMPDAISNIIDSAVISGNKNIVPDSCWGVEWNSEPSPTNSNAEFNLPTNSKTESNTSYNDSIMRELRMAFSTKKQWGVVKLTFDIQDRLYPLQTSSNVDYDKVEEDIESCLEKMHTDGYVIFDDDIYNTVSGACICEYVSNSVEVNTNKLRVQGINCYNANQQSIDTLITQVIFEIPTSTIAKSEFEVLVFKKLLEKGLTDNITTCREIINSHNKKDKLGICEIVGDTIILNKHLLTASADILEQRRKEVLRANANKSYERNKSENDKIFDKMVSHMSTEKECTVSELVTALDNMYSQMKISALLRQHLDRGEIAVAERNGTKYYRLNK